MACLQISEDIGLAVGDMDIAQNCCRQLERGEILFFSQSPVVTSEDCAYLIQQSIAASRLHKNISYRPAEDKLRGFDGSREERRRLHQALQRYSSKATEFVSSFLAPYAGKLIVDYASFRPIEEQGRTLSLHKRNDLLHVDAFPTRPTHGGRILRVFSNVNPSKNRVWVTSERFPELAKRYAVEAGLREIAGRRSGCWHWLSSRSAYDRFMLRFHHFLKENPEFQNTAARQRIEFPPMSSWLVFTDGVSHAALSGQFALEQTFIVHRNALVSPEDAPISVLERMCGRDLAA